jgi:hypothetical protein
MLGPIMPAPGGGDARRPLAVAFRRHRTGGSFHEVDPERTHHGRRLLYIAARRRWLKTEREMMKLKVQFGWEIRYGQPIRCITRTRARWLRGIQASLRALAMAGRPEPIKPE